MQQPWRIRATLKGRLIAWDPIAQEARWSVEHLNAWNGGVLSTAGGLVFQGRLEGDFAAYNASTGEKLWRHNVKAGAASGPGTFEIDGEQYVTITTGWGSAYALAGGSAYDQPVPPIVGKVVTFKLGATETIPDHNLVMAPRTPKTDKFGDSRNAPNRFRAIPLQLSRLPRATGHQFWGIARFTLVCHQCKCRCLAISRARWCSVS